MATKKGKKTNKKATVDKSHKQTVRQSVVVNVNTKDTSKPKKRQSAANVKSFTKGMTYMAGTPYRSMVFPILQHNILSQQPAHQPVFQHDVINRISALENLQRSRVTDEQQARSVVTPLATQTPTATKPIGIMETPSTMDLLRDTATPTVSRTPEYVADTLQKLDEDRQKDVSDIRDIMRASTNTFSNELYGDDEDQSPLRSTPQPSLARDRSPYELRRQSQEDAAPSTSGGQSLSQQFEQVQQQAVEKVKAKKGRKGKEPAEQSTVTNLVPLYEQINQENRQKAEKQTRTKIPKLPGIEEQSSSK